ncbi:MAG: hypothetical protein HC834_01280 [Rhodospirillales bacterium]|nr:hypothetical protein [Rhodospirillales bacterium]
MSIPLLTPDNPAMRRYRKDITPWSGLDRVTEAALIAAFPAKGSNPFNVWTPCISIVHATIR